MHIAKKIISGLILFAPILQVYAVGIKFDLSIYEDDLLAAGIKRIEIIEPDVNKVGERQKISIQHAITTGDEKANHEFLIMTIPNLESISPSLDSFKIMSQGKQTAITDAQVDSIISQRKELKGEIPEWLSDKSKKKYIQTILVKNQISAVTVQDAKALVDWAIKEGRLNDYDHPQAMNNKKNSNTAP